MAKYHINPTTGRANKCGAVKGNCPFGGDSEHFPSAEQARKSYEAAMSASAVAPSTKKAKPPVASSKFKLRPKRDATFIVEYDYDSYDCSDPDYCQQSDDYCRDKVYENLHVVSVTPDQVYDYASARLGIDCPDELKQRLAPLMGDLTDSGSWEAYGEQDYYGEVPHISPPQELDQAIEDWYRDQPDAVDEENILGYVRGRGLDTTGMTPLQAIKESLAQENNGMRLPEVEKATQVTVVRMSLKSPRVPNKTHYSTAQGKKPEVAHKELTGAPEIVGVVVETTPHPQAGRWNSDPKLVGETRLVDGNHRLKYLAEQSNRRSGNFILLRSK